MAAFDLFGATKTFDYSEFQLIYLQRAEYMLLTR